MWLALASLLVAPPALDRGHDPWVFRTPFEERPRMLLFAAGEEIWFAFNVHTCALQKVWKGGVDFRGKVYDFSQLNSRATGQVWAEMQDTLAALPYSNRTPAGWELKGVNTGSESLSFTGSGASITSPLFDTTGWQDIYVGFDERSARGRFEVQILDNNLKVVEKFQSATSVEGNAAWWANSKEIHYRGPSRLRIVQTDATHLKELRSIRVFGNQPAWELTQNGVKQRITPRYLGYEVGSGLTIMVALQKPDGSQVKVNILPERDGAIAWRENYQVEGLNGTEKLRLRWMTTQSGMSRAITSDQTGSNREWLEFGPAGASLTGGGR